MTQNNKKSFILLQTAVMMFGLSGVIGRIVNVSPVTLTAGRVLFSSVILFLILKIKKQSIKADTLSDSLLTVIAGLVLMVHWVTFFQSVKTASVAIGTITYSTFPLFLLFLEPIIYKEKLKAKSTFVAVGLIVGVFITIPEFSFSNGVTLGIILGMLCSLCYAVLTLINRNLSGKYTGMWISFREQSVVAILLLPVVILRHENITKLDFLGIMGIGIICTALAFSLFVTAQKGVTALTAGISAGMETVYGIIFALLFIGEVPSLRAIIGGIIILGVSVISGLKTENS